MDPSSLSSSPRSSSSSAARPNDRKPMSKSPSQQQQQQQQPSLLSHPSPPSYHSIVSSSASSAQTHQSTLDIQHADSWASATSGMQPSQAAFVFNANAATRMDTSSDVFRALSSNGSDHDTSDIDTVMNQDNTNNIIDDNDINNNNNNNSNETTTTTHRKSWLYLLILPARLAVGALTFVAGARLSLAFNSSSSSSSSSSSISTVPSTSPTTEPPSSSSSSSSPFPLQALLQHPIAWVGGIAAAAFSQVIITTAISRARRRKRRRADEEVEQLLAQQQRLNWLDAVQAVGKIVDRFAHGLGSPDTFESIRSMFLDVSLARLVHLSALQRRVRIARSRPRSTSDCLVRGRRFLDYALASYGFLLLRLTGVVHADYDVMVEGSRGEDVARYLLGMNDDDDMIVAHLDGEEINVPRHFVAMDHESRAIVVSIRGTNSISDIITDLICGNESFGQHHGYAHGGMKSAAESLCASLLPTLHSLRVKFPRYYIVVTGHSLGAGVAILLTKLLLDSGFEDTRCYAFAPCPVFGPLHRVDSEWSDALECFVHADDLVATLCLSSARALALEIERIDKKVDLDINKKRDIVNANDATTIEKLLSRSRSRNPDPREDEVDQLFIPCHRGIHWLIPDKDDDNDNYKNTNNNEENNDDNNDDMEKQNVENAVDAYNKHWGPREQAQREKKWKQQIHQLNDVDMVPPAYIPTDKFSSYIVRSRHFEKILVTPNCVNAHFPNMYTAAFAGLDLPPRKRPLPPKPKPNYTRSWYENELG